MRRLLLVVCTLALTVPALAQTATVASKYAWDEAGPDLASVQAYAYRAYVDGATTGVSLTATCTGTASPFVCTAPMGAFTQGAHAVAFSATNAAGESAKSAVVSFTFVVLPATPANARIQ